MTTSDSPLPSPFTFPHSHSAAKFDVGTATLNGCMFLLAIIQMAPKGADPLPFFVAAVCSFAVAAVAARGWPSSRVRVAVIAVTRVSTAAGTCASAWLRADTPDGVPEHWRPAPGAKSPPFWALLKTPRTHALALPALGFMLPPWEHLVASCFALAVIASAHRSTVIGREAYFGRQPHAIIGAGFSAATRALFNPFGPATAISDARVTLFVCWAVHVAGGCIAPFIVSRAWLCGARARFRATAGPPKPALRGDLTGLYHTATWDNATLGVASVFGASLAVWSALEWVDKWLRG